jgi:hypothetical protein
LYLAKPQSLPRKMVEEGNKGIGAMQFRKFEEQRQQTFV